mgnify:FL=1|jgi:hypothetical protein
MVKTLGEKYKRYRKVMIAPAHYMKLQRMADKSGLAVNDVVNMILANNFEQMAKNG